ncbi:MAG: VWA domain-containing protein, partial [Nitrosomonadaceae bacterium]|nr:VWA domain-containing protein [Nitrosomonadaceae bacterium]
RDLAAFKAALHVNSPDEVAARLIQLKAREEKHAGLQADHEKLQADFKTLHGELQSRNAAELTVRQELIGIDAKRLKRVAILLDTSSSMTESSAWKDASRLIQLWLTHLQIEECVLISFNSTVHVYPKSGYLRIRTPEKKVVEENRKELLKQVKEAPFGRFTDTLGALKMAYSLNGVEMVLLFTDGRPQTEGSRYAKLAPQIFDLVKLHSDIPIVAVGLGDYEKLELEDKKADKSLQIHFLKEIARLSGGNFSAR